MARLSVEEQLEAAEEQIDDLNRQLVKPVPWGNCIRGCQPSYLDKQGFCSPACHVGAPRGEFVTLAEVA
jgi:hypothetical protein